jgi:hypothetical protein
VARTLEGVQVRRTGSLIVAVARRPSLWATGLRQARTLVPTGWWKRRPFLPLPTRDYLALRAITQYGDPNHAPDADDVVAYLQWLRQWRAAGT